MALYSSWKWHTANSKLILMDLHVLGAVAEGESI